MGGSLLPDQGRLVAALERSGSTTSGRWRAVRASSVALSRRDSSSSMRSARARRAGLRRQGVDGVADDGRLEGRRLASAERLEGGGQLGDQLPGVDHSPASLAPGQAGEVGEPVARGAPVQPLAGQVADVGLGQQCDSSAVSCPFSSWTAASPSIRSWSETPGDEPVVERTHLDAGARQHDRWRDNHGVHRWLRTSTPMPGDPPLGTRNDRDASAPPRDEPREHNPRDYCISATRGPRAGSIRTYIRTNVKRPAELDGPDRLPP